MKISDYVVRKYLKGTERDSFFKRFKGYDSELTPVNLFRKLTVDSNYSAIAGGIQMLGELEVRDRELETEVLDYCGELMTKSASEEDYRGIIDLAETILWALAEIGSIDSIEFLRELIINGGEWLRINGDPEHVLSACQYSFYRINQRELNDFFIKTRSMQEVPVKTQVEIDALWKLNPKYAEFQQFLLDNHRKYEGGGLN